LLIVLRLRQHRLPRPSPREAVLGRRCSGCSASRSTTACSWPASRWSRRAARR
jgi:hypothetical protein